MTSEGTATLQRDVALVRGMAGIRTILELLCETTDCRIALVARVTDDSWTACEVLDAIGLGMKSGDTLEIAQTY